MGYTVEPTQFQALPEGPYEITLTKWTESDKPSQYGGKYPLFLHFAAKSLESGEIGEFREIANPSLGAKARFRFLAEGILGRPLANDEAVDVDALIGIPRRAYIGENERGYNIVQAWSKNGQQQRKVVAAGPQARYSSTGEALEDLPF